LKKAFILFILFSSLFAHNPEGESVGWAQYYRIGTVKSNIFNSGFTGYGRIKRTTSQTFKDLRFFTHSYKNKTEIRTRYKSSRRFLRFNNFYTFNTIIYEKNTTLNMNLRYLYSQGVGWISQNRKSGNMTLEIGPAFDNSDYLNSEQKTSYLRSGYSIDYEIKDFKTKFEVDYFYQISNNVKNQARSLIQTLSELQWNFNKSVGITIGFSKDYRNKRTVNSSIWGGISFFMPIQWSI
jgi:hypothetical protein|tara:strand:+ start:3721 stop:4431 length:711 start_codon:yes stop_codon:yes gene_type:complete